MLSAIQGGTLMRRITGTMFVFALALATVSRYGSNHIIGRQRPPDALQLELTDWLDLHGVLDFINTRGLMRICPGFASSHSREATLDTVPIAA